MSRDLELKALVDMIYDAALDSDLWPSVLIRLADAMAVPQVAMPSLDRSEYIRCDRSALRSLFASILHGILGVP
jgi:hypothetical protein